MLFHTLASIDRREHADALVIPIFKGSEVTLDGLTDIIRTPIKAGDFTGKVGEVTPVWGKDPREPRIFLLGLGEKEKCSFESLRRSLAALSKEAGKRKCKSLNLLLPEIDYLPPDGTIKAVCEGLFLGAYVFDKLKGKSLIDDPTTRLEEVTLIGPDLHLTAQMSEKVKKIMTAVYQVRDLVNANADDCTSEYLASYAKELAQEFPRLKTVVRDRAWMQAENMGLLLAVSRAAAYEPAFIECSYRGNPASHDHTVIVGKGVTFDTGGLSLKTQEGMDSMRSDMAGAAVVLGTLQAISSLGLPVNVTGVIPACENAIDSRSYKLGDVYKSRAGITVEVNNTDAEGRLILADALSYAVDKLAPTRLIDIGTLTGAMEISLGAEVMGYFSNSDILAEELWHSGQRTFERAWRLPLYEEYKEYLKSDVGDIKNTASRKKGGAILCAAFLQHFVKDVPWSHIDIAGVAFYNEPLRYWPKNATGIGVRFFVDYFEHLAKNAE